NQYYEEEYDNEEYTSKEYYEEEKCKIYLNIRSKPYPKNTISKNKRKQVKSQNPLKPIIVDNLKMEDLRLELILRLIKVEK
ncbi:6031_t:CDS:1, partial [Funneliformis caledonium]